LGLRLFSFGGYGLALAALARLVLALSNAPHFFFPFLKFLISCGGTLSSRSDVPYLNPNYLLKKE